MAPEEPIAENAYDAMADSYDEVRNSPYNADIEFPATTSLLPDVEGKRVLDAGCGSGVYTAWLAERGADVVGIDVSTEMLKHARDALGGRATFLRTTIGGPLDAFETGTFDGIVSALALGYVRDWTVTMSAFDRLLKPGGFLVFSTAHPFDQFPFDETDDGGNYFEIERGEADWEVTVPYFRRPMSAIVDPLLQAGFRLEAFREPQPTARFAERWPERYEKESRYPVFLCVRARKPPA